MEELARESTKSNGSMSELDSETLRENYNLLENIAVLIQKIWRGYRTRKIIKEYFAQFFNEENNEEELQEKPQKVYGSLEALENRFEREIEKLNDFIRKNSDSLQKFEVNPGKSEESKEKVDSNEENIEKCSEETKENNKKKDQRTQEHNFTPNSGVSKSNDSKRKFSEEQQESILEKPLTEEASSEDFLEFYKGKRPRNISSCKESIDSNRKRFHMY